MARRWSPAVSTRPRGGRSVPRTWRWSPPPGRRHHPPPAVRRDHFQPVSFPSPAAPPPPEHLAARPGSRAPPESGLRPPARVRRLRRWSPGAARVVDQVRDGFGPTSRTWVTSTGGLHPREHRQEPGPSGIHVHAGNSKARRPRPTPPRRNAGRGSPGTSSGESLSTLPDGCNGTLGHCTPPLPATAASARYDLSRAPAPAPSPGRPP